MRVKITIPDELYAAIKAKAENNCRTLSQEICYVLSGSECPNVSHCGTIVGQGGPQGDTNSHNKEEENANVSQEVDIKVGQCDPLVSQSDPEGDTMTHCGTEGDSSVPLWDNSDTQGDNVSQSNTKTQGDTEDQGDTQETTNKEETERPFDVSYMPQYNAYNFVTDACNIVPLDALEELGIKPIEYPPIDWDAVAKKAELQSKAVKDNSGNIIGYLINGQVVKEEDLPF